MPLSCNNLILTLTVTTADTLRRGDDDASNWPLISGTDRQRMMGDRATLHLLQHRRIHAAERLISRMLGMFFMLFVPSTDSTRMARGVASLPWPTITVITHHLGWLRCPLSSLLSKLVLS